MEARTRTVRIVEFRNKLLVADIMSANDRRMGWAYALPVSVRATPRGSLTNNSVPSLRSKSRICWLTAAGVIPNSSAAAEKLACRAAASKLWSHVTWGSLAITLPTMKMMPLLTKALFVL
ncbi:hypothetical protein D9M70_509780 [compost metagenome]